MSNFRVTEEMIKEQIVNKTFTTLPSGKVIVCELTLKNGFSVRGEASVVDKENFVQEIGEKISYDDAFNKIWALLGYEMQTKLYKKKLKEKAMPCGTKKGGGKKPPKK